ncbi:MAG: GntR family transcriptional regulator [Pseudomonadales bacterium]|nr:GntR family transcriptional regulator [Pseudomonadales bacterium]
MSFEASTSLAEQIADYIGQQIITGELRDHERVQEQKFAKHLEVSRGSVREALLILEARHLIDIIPRRGAVVSALTIQHVENFYEVVIVLYVLLAQKVAAIWKGDDLKPFMEMARDMKELVKNGDEKEFFSMTFKFGQKANPLIKNTYLEEILENLAPVALRTRHLADTVNQNSMEESLEFNNDIIAGVRLRDMGIIKTVVVDYYAKQRDLVIAAIHAAKSKETASVG